jgi:hypothetical protein
MLGVGDPPGDLLHVPLVASFALHGIRRMAASISSECPGLYRGGSWRKSGMVTQEGVRTSCREGAILSTTRSLWICV